jgi:hypothetical protein
MTTTKGRRVRTAAAVAVAAAAAATLAVTTGLAQNQNDPRVGLKGGYTDAAVAASNLELVAHVPRPQGFFDAESPAGVAVPPEKKEPEQKEEEKKEEEKTPATPPGQPAPLTPEQRRLSSALNFANSDLAFQGDRLFMGNFNGFTVYDVANPVSPTLVAGVVCPGGQGDLSVHGNLLVMSVEQTRGRLDCGTAGVEEPVSKERFRGVRIFDISDVTKPKQLAAVQTCRGSHTHTLVTAPGDTANLYIYGSGTSSVRSGEELEGCSGGDAKDDPETALFSIDVIKVPLADPSKAAIVNRPRIFADLKTGAVGGLWPGGDHGPGTQTTSTTNQCHDITVFPEVGLAAGACSGNGILLDISDPVHPRRLDDVSDKNFAYWHSATFNNDATKVIFTDEWGGGVRPRCRAEDLPNWGADAIFGIADRRLTFGGYFKLPAAQTETENCVAHNGSLVPVPGRDIMVQGWYQGGVSVFDFTDAAHPVEIAYFDRGPVDPQNLIVAGYWSAYWYNGYIYGSEIARGLDVFRLTPSEHLSQNEIDAAIAARATEVNTQYQKKVTWPATSVVARAYLDQLTRTRAVDAARISAINEALDVADRPGATRAAAAGALEAQATALKTAAASATGTDASRLRALADTLTGRAAALR